MMSEFDEQIARAALALPETIARIVVEDGPAGDETRLWHLVRSLLEYCDHVHPRIDFDALLQEVREDFNR